MKRILIVFIVCVLISACRGVDDVLLVNEWQGISLTIDGQPISDSPDVLRLTFRSDASYTFVKQEGTVEHGRYSTLSNMLYLHPNYTNDKTPYKVAHLSSDTLVLTSKIRDVHLDFVLISVNSE